MKLKEELKELLNNDKRFVSDGKILKNKVVESALKLDKDLIKLLLSNEIIKELFLSILTKL
jgi:adenine-specific DNA-methyltransferase